MWAYFCKVINRVKEEFPNASHSPKGFWAKLSFGSRGLLQIKLTVHWESIPLPPSPGFLPTSHIPGPRVAGAVGLWLSSCFFLASPGPPLTQQPESVFQRSRPAVYLEQNQTCLSWFTRKEPNPFPVFLSYHITQPPPLSCSFCCSFKTLSSFSASTLHLISPPSSSLASHSLGGNLRDLLWEVFLLPTCGHSPLHYYDYFYPSFQLPCRAQWCDC